MQQYDLLALRSFLAVIDSGSFVNAAEQLETSTASISRRISALEATLGSQLIVRSTRRLDLTEAGRRFYEDVINVFQLLGEAEERVRRGRERIAGSLRVAAPLSFGIQEIALRLPLFLRRYPELKVHLHYEDRLTDLQAEGIDVAVRIGALKDSALVATRICAIERIYCASPEYLERRGTPRVPADLKHHDCLRYSLLSTRDEWGGALDAAGEAIEIAGPLAANNAESLREAAIQGIGITMLPEFVVRDALRDGRLQPVLEDFRPSSSTLYAVRLSRQFTPSRLRVFIEFLHEAFGDGLHA